MRCIEVVFLRRAISTGLKDKHLKGCHQKEHLHSSDMDENVTKKKSYMNEAINERMLIPARNRRRSDQSLEMLEGESLQKPHEADEKSFRHKGIRKVLGCHMVLLDCRVWAHTMYKIFLFFE